MTLTDQVVAAVRADDAHAVAALLKGRAEKERAPVGRAVKKLAAERSHPLDRAFYWKAAYGLAVLGSVSPARQVARLTGWQRFPLQYEALAVEVLTDRNPAWLQGLPAALLGQGGWRLVRGLVRCGAVPAPDHPDYTLGMIHRFARSNSDLRPPVSRVLAADPGLLDDEVLRLFRVEGAAPAL